MNVTRILLLGILACACQTVDKSPTKPPKPSVQILDQKSLGFRDNFDSTRTPAVVHSRLLSSGSQLQLQISTHAAAPGVSAAQGGRGIRGENITTAEEFQQLLSDPEHQIRGQIRWHEGARERFSGRLQAHSWHTFTVRHLDKQVGSFQEKAGPRLVDELRFSQGLKLHQGQAQIELELWVYGHKRLSLKAKVSVSGPRPKAKITEFKQYHAPFFSTPGERP